MKTKPSKSIVIYPILLAVFPLLAIAAVNREQIDLTDATRPVLISAAFGLLVFLLAWALTRDAQRGGLLAGIALTGIFTYGHLYGLLKAVQWGGYYPFRHRTLLPVFLALLALAVWAAYRWVKNPRRVTAPLNLAVSLLVVFQVAQIGLYQFRLAQQAAVPQVNPDGLPAALQGVDPASLPDVYYILMDGYGRQDVIESYYGYDNSAFIAELKSLGFYLPDCAQSNYALTPLSITSSFQMQPISVIENGMPQPDALIDYPRYTQLIRSSPIRTTLEGLGYTSYAFETFWPFLNIEDADVYLQASKDLAGIAWLGSPISRFEFIALQTTLLRPLLDTNEQFLKNFGSVLTTPERQHYDRILYQFDQLERISKAPGKKFVWAHIAAPHTPLVFNPDGSFKASDWENGVSQELVYINQRILTVLKDILANSAVPPVIILQADHAWPTDKDLRMRILNAYYLPGAGKDLLYPQITPVNTFRVVLNAYFGGEYNLLPDESYYSLYERPFDFQPVPLDCLSQ